MLERPREDQPHYGAHLGDATYWGPYVQAGLRRSQLPTSAVEAPFVGTFPTFLVGRVVVKLFGEGFDGAASCAAEVAMHELLAAHPAIPAPAVVATGHLFEEEPCWSYLITERLSAEAIRDAHLDDNDAVEVALRLGETCRLLHRLPAPAPVADRSLVPGLRAASVDRLQRYGLPAHLLEQVPEYLEDALPASTLVHADITADHVFVQHGRLAGIIDWGDAIVADPFYELVAVYLDAFRGQRRLLRAFLDAYGWPRDADFARRALQAVLEFQFDAIATVRGLVDLHGAADLDELAGMLFYELD